MIIAAVAVVEAILVVRLSRYGREYRHDHDDGTEPHRRHAHQCRRRSLVDLRLRACSRSPPPPAPRCRSRPSSIAAPLAYVLSAIAAVIYLVTTVCLARSTPLSRRVGIACCTVELFGVIIVGIRSLFWRSAFPAHRLVRGRDGLVRLSASATRSCRSCCRSPGCGGSGGARSRPLTPECLCQKFVRASREPGSFGTRHCARGFPHSGISAPRVA